MRFGVLSNVLLCLVFLLACSSLKASYDNQIVDKLDIILSGPSGKETMESRNSAEKLKTRVGGCFSQVNFDCDLKLLSMEYDRIEPSIVSEEGHLFITIKVWEKPTIRSIRWEGNCKVRTCDLKSELGVSVCSPFDRQAFNRAFHKLQSYYIKSGFFESELSYDVGYDECTNQVDITIEICEGRSGKVKDIQFYNFTKCEREELLERMVTKRYKLLTSWMSGEGIYHDEGVQHDRMNILTYLQNKGYADADVQIEICEANQSNRIIIKIIAYKGERYRVGNVTFKGNTIFDDGVISSIIGICGGEPFSPEELHCSVQRLTELYGRRGYIDTFVNFETKLRCDQDVYDISFNIEEGCQYRVGLIKVIGNCVTQTAVILNETLLIPGQLFDSHALCKTEERLRNIGFFKRVNVYAVRPEGATVFPGNYRNVHIEVEEDVTGNIGAFGGYSTMESVFIGLNVTERNFNYKGLCDVLQCGPRVLRGGGEYAHLTMSVGAKSRRGVLSWTKPFFHDTLWSVGFDLEALNNRYISDDYNINSIGLTLHAMYDVNAFVKTGVHYRIGYTHIPIIDKDDASRALRSEAKKSGLVSAVGATWIYDTTNHPQFPTKGFRSRLEGECAGLGGKQSYLTGSYLNSWYVPIAPIDPKGYFLLRANFKYVLPYGHTTADDVPLEARLFLGGDETVRGYRPYVLGPQFSEFCVEVEGDGKDQGNIKHHHHKIHTKVPRKNHRYNNDGKISYHMDPSVDDDPTGGLSIEYYSLEFDHVFSPRITAFMFADAGQISSRRWAFGHMYTSIGYGVRLNVIPSMPPITLGIGYPFNAKDHSDVKRFFFNIGGKF